MIKQRNIALCIIFTIITCGIYGLYWFVCLTDETNAIAQENGTSGILALIPTTNINEKEMRFNRFSIRPRHMLLCIGAAYSFEDTVPFL